VRRFLERSRRSANLPQLTGIDIIDRDNTQSDHPKSEDDNKGEENVDFSGYVKLRWNLNQSLSESGLEGEAFDLINSRFLADGINSSRWPGLVEDCWELLVPGGWLQMVEPVWAFQSAFGQTLPCLEAWWNHYAHAQVRAQARAQDQAQAQGQMGKDPRVGRILSEYMTNARANKSWQSITAYARDVPAAGWKIGMSGYAHIFQVFIIGS
jgi:hypothetical protein